jgi:hypothetical protein
MRSCGRRNLLLFRIRAGVALDPARRLSPDAVRRANREVILH